jgi:hypothetical protein
VNDHYIEEANLSFAWARALSITCGRGRSEATPLVVAVTGFDQDGNPEEHESIRVELDRTLRTTGKQSVHTVANTIFPLSLWDPGSKRKALFDRYARISARLRKASPKNSRGTYFGRMITGGPPGKENQLEVCIGAYLARPAVRRSALQVAVFNPNVDHSTAAQLGFPCLQHVTFAPAREGLCVNAFYATQYMIERAYGNYLGLCRLGRFVARELDLPLVRMTCFTGIAKCELPKNKLARLLATFQSSIPATVGGA